MNRHEMTRHERMKYQAKATLLDIASDTTVDRSTVMQSLQDLREEIDVWISEFCVQIAAEKELQERSLDHD